MESLVDSSVWISFLNGYDTSLDDLIPKNKAVTNEVIMMELVPFFHALKNRYSLDLVKGAKLVPLKIDWDHLSELRVKNLQNGINKVGIPDLLILQQALQNKLPICTLDKHFKLMQEIFDFELIEG